MQAEILRSNGDVLEVATGTEEEIRARFAALDAYCLNWTEEQESVEPPPEPGEVPTALHVAPSMPAEPAVPMSTVEVAFKHPNNTAAVKRLFKGHDDRLFSDGKGRISNGHWLVRFAGEPFDNLPTHVDVKAGAFPLKEPASIRCGEIQTGDDANVPEFDQICGCLDESNERAMLAQERGFVKRLEGQTFDCYQIVASDPDALPAKEHKPVHVNAKYLEQVLALNKDKPADFLQYTLCEITDELSPVVVRLCVGIDAIIMPVRA